MFSRKTFLDSLFIQTPLFITFYRNFGVLPTSETCERVKEEFVFFVAKSIVPYMPAFESFKKHIPRHINHPFVKEMSQKSTVVPLGLIFENENTSSGMAKILREIQEKYVPNGC